jgi:hypothetical protein
VVGSTNHAAGHDGAGYPQAQKAAELRPRVPAGR